jgi:hypothetical protein
MNIFKLCPIMACLLLGCNAEPKPPQKPTPITTKSSPADFQAIEIERQREARTPCSAEWLKMATEVQKKNCLQQNSINQAMDALSTPPASAKKPVTPASTSNH